MLTPLCLNYIVSGQQSKGIIYEPRMSYRQTVNVPYGIPDYDGSQDLADLEYTFLAEATPGDANSGVQESGPFVAG